MEDDHRWILESFSGMDVAEVDDVVPSSAPSVRFDDGIASERDSTERIFDACLPYSGLPKYNFLMLLESAASTSLTFAADLREFSGHPFS
ncbi:unnamed protein product [Onchocerca flexuosa]|uniref:Uncharacterized protein n=1 Tax=Onchocerca flexuosa TaxID=387005 RepID=A0A183HPD6_9BILA|nr:unnamed protein product [Onchocerca flexuosa]